MRIRMITVTLAVLATASLLVSQIDQSVWAALHLGALKVLTPDNCKLCAHILVAIGLLLEAAALWLHSMTEDRPGLTRVIASLLGGAGILLILSISIELLTHPFTVSPEGLVRNIAQSMLTSSHQQAV